MSSWRLSRFCSLLANQVSLSCAHTGDAVNCPAIGSHWTIIGFQGNNPATDLRGAGMFALLQMLVFLQKGSRLPSDIFLLSRHAVHHFPFCAVSINMTAISLDYLRKGRLTPLVNSKGSGADAEGVLDAVNSCYMALFYRFYRFWRQGKTIIDFDQAKKTLEGLSSRQLVALIQEYRQAQQDLASPVKAQVAVAATAAKSKGPSFTQMDI
jgi:ELMO domain-containing protein